MLQQLLKFEQLRGGLIYLIVSNHSIPLFNALLLLLLLQVSMKKPS